MYFGPMDPSKICVYTYGDSSKGKPPQRGMTTFIGETIPDGACPIVRAYLYRWASKKQTRSISSTMATESLAAESALDVQYATRRRIQEALNLEEPPAGLLLTDSWSLVTNTYSTTPHITEEDLIPSLSRIREACVGWQRTVNSKVLPSDLSWVPDASMVADPLTKPNSNPSKILDPIRSCSIDLRSAARPTSRQRRSSSR